MGDVIMMLRRWLSLGCFALGASLAASRAEAQLAPIGGHYAGKSSDTGYEGAVNSSGGYQSSVPLDLPGARGGLPVPVQIVYGERGVGAAGLGWDVPLSYLRRDITFARRRPVSAAGVAPQPREQVSVVLEGHRTGLVRTATGWAARSDAPDIEVRQQTDGSWVMFDGHGRSYFFTSPSSALTGTNVWLLTDVTGVGGSKVHLDYSITTPALPGGAGLAIDLTAVSYNPSPTTAGCYKNTVNLTYDAAGATPLSLSTLGSTVVARMHKLTSVDIYGKSVCSTSGELLRKYQFAYQADADTAQPRLQSVTVVGRTGTPENSTPLPVTSYTYGAASAGGKLTYTTAGTLPILLSDLGNTSSSAPPRSDLPDVNLGWSTIRMLNDINGDGRPDYFFPSPSGWQFARNSSTANASSFSAASDVWDNNVAPRAIETRTTKEIRYKYAGPDNIELLWRQAIDVNGDGRIDIVDAAETSGHWVIYLNTPDPDNPALIRWARRQVSIASLAQYLTARGLSANATYLPLARRRTRSDGSTFACWIYDGFEWVLEEPDSFFLCPGNTDPPRETTITEWEVRDVNGDGYPDVVFNSSPVIVVTDVTPLPDDANQGDHLLRKTTITQRLKAGSLNRIDAVLDVIGVRLTDGDDQPFSAPITLRNFAPCGVGQWTTNSALMDSPQLTCGLADVNGDGLVDLVDGTSVYLGTGSPGSGGLFTPGAMFTLPGPLGIHKNNQYVSCQSPATSDTTFSAAEVVGIRDLTGDGIPDYVAGSPGAWNVYVGTGTGFTGARPISGTFALSAETENCGGTSSTTNAGLFDLDGDGKADVLSGGKWYQLVGSSGLSGAPDAGKLVQVDNGFGAQTHIHYRSIKGDLGVHQVPFPEIVVDSVDTTGTNGLGGTLAATRYAYAGAELMFDPAVDAFAFRGYQHKIEMTSPVAQPVGVATFTITDTYAPVSAVDPYGIAGSAVPDAVPDAAQRYTLYQRAGRVSDVTTLSGDFGAAALATPSLLFAINFGSDARRIGATHYEWGARRLSSTSDPAGPEPCTEAVFPYNYASSTTFVADKDHYDPCTARGFAYELSVRSWRGDPGAAPPSMANVETLSEVTIVDDLGRVQSVKHSNDVHRGDDNLCIDTVYATPTGSNERVLSAVSSRTVSDCGTTIYASDRWEYDQLPQGSVSAGLLTSHTVERRTESGALIDSIRQFDTSYDASGNPISVTTTREDGATRAVTVGYDPFGLAIVSLTTTATGVPTLQVSITRDPVTLMALSTTDPSGTQRGATFDGFDRPVLSTVTPPGGTAGALAIQSYVGFTGNGAQPRQIVQKVFTDAVAPNTASTAPGRVSTVFLDELGRAYRGDFALGDTYSNQTLRTQRTYDGWGRVAFEADPFPSTQSFTTAYGTTRFFNADGTLSCIVRGNGPQAAIANPPATNESQELYPTCWQRTFQSYTEVVSVRDASSYLAQSPQQDVTRSSYLTAIGWLVGRSTWQGANRLEHATFSYDPLGRMTAMTRYQDAIEASKPVTSSWHYDSLGQLLELDDPGSAPRVNTYSRWGELVDSSRIPPTSDAPPEGPVGGSPTPSDSVLGLHVLSKYDALGRVIHTEQQNSGVVDPETVHDYFYDQGVAIAPQVTPTFVLGRLAQATSPTGTVSFSYDPLGQVNARVFTDEQSGLYVEKHAYHGDGTLQSIDLFLPDTGYADEQVTYGYDSAGRGNSVTYASGGSSQSLYAASQIDPFGRVRQAQYGQASYNAAYADVGRRLLNQVTVSSMAGSRAIAFQALDPVGRERSRVETKNGTGGTTTNHTYDALGRLSSSIRTASNTTLSSQQFTYDPLGNLVTQLDSVGGPGALHTTLTYSDSDRDRICRIAYGPDSGTDCNVTYDEVGAITSMSTPTGMRQFSYLPDGSIRTIEDDHASAHFRYDAFGQVQELDLTTGAPPFVPDTRRDRRYGELIAWRDENAGASTTSVLLRKIPGPDGFLATRHGAGGAWVFAFGEARGNRFFTDQNGAFVQDIDYQPFGKATSTGAQPGSQLYSNEQWNDGDALAAFGISQLGARLYDPAIGRFLSRDPLLIPRTAATTNPYAFAANDPVNASDPTGLDFGDEQNPTKKRDPWEVGGEPSLPGPNSLPTGNSHTGAAAWNQLRDDAQKHKNFSPPLDPSPAHALNTLAYLGPPAGAVAGASVALGATGAAAADVSIGAGAAVGGGAATVGAVGLGAIIGLALIPAAIGSLTFVIPGAGDTLVCAEDPTICVERDLANDEARRPEVNLDTSAIIAATQLRDPWLNIGVRLFLSDKRPVVTVTAMGEFLSGNYRYAGPRERLLVEEFLRGVRVIPDNPSAEVMRIPARPKQLNDQIIFGTGHQRRIPTITGDKKAVNWLKAHVNIETYIHPFARYAGK